MTHVTIMALNHKCQNLGTIRLFYNLIIRLLNFCLEIQGPLMTTKTYSIDLRTRVIQSLQSGFSCTQTADRFLISARTVRRWQAQHKETGSVNPKYRGNHRASKIKAEDLQKIVSENQNVTLKQIGEKLGVHTSTVGRRMKKIKLVYKKKTFHYREADPEKQAAYLKAIEEFSKNKDLLVYMDESGMQERDAARTRGWGVKGKLLIDQKMGKRSPRTNVIAAYCNGKILAPCTFFGTCIHDFFKKWVSTFLVKELTPGQIVIMDNAPFHKSDEIKELIKSAGCHLIYLPPYSPNLNPIEHFWANLKRYVRDSRDQFETLQDAMDAYLRRPEFAERSAA